MKISDAFDVLLQTGRRQLLMMKAIIQQRGDADGDIQPQIDLLSEALEALQPVITISAAEVLAMDDDALMRRIFPTRQ